MFFSGFARFGCFLDASLYLLLFIAILVRSSNDALNRFLQTDLYLYHSF